jgi:hypothetical protein
MLEPVYTELDEPIFRYKRNIVRDLDGKIRSERD